MPERRQIDIEAEFALIEAKKSTLSSSERAQVVELMRIRNGGKRVGAIAVAELILAEFKEKCPWERIFTHTGELFADLLEKRIAELKGEKKEEKPL
jgi:hypothetical protein